ALIAAAGIDRAKAQSLAAAIADYRDADDLRRKDGGEAAEDRSAKLAWGPKNGPFEAIDELRQVLGMTSQINAQLVRNVTLYSVQDYSAAPSGRMATDQPLRKSLRLAGLNSLFPGSPGLVVSIRAKATTPNGGIFIREAIVQRSSAGILSWSQG